METHTYEKRTAPHRSLLNQGEQYRKAALIACLLAFPYFFYQVFWHYREKNRWYFRI